MARAFHLTIKTDFISKMGLKMIPSNEEISFSLLFSVIVTIVVVFRLNQMSDPSESNLSQLCSPEVGSSEISFESGRAQGFFYHKIEKKGKIPYLDSRQYQLSQIHLQMEQSARDLPEQTIHKSLGQMPSVLELNFQQVISSFVAASLPLCWNSVCQMEGRSEQEQDWCGRIEVQVSHHQIIYKYQYVPIN